MERSAKKRRICDYYGTTTGPSCSHGMVTSSGYDCEVFLSFRGPDTRSGFTDFLYTSLKDAGIRTFKDDEDLRVGEEFASELLQAINQSKISIPIFSKGYASSLWCLKELAQMVECQKTRGHKIMPIFYDVAPSEVRHQTGGYGEAFRSHENKKRYDETAISQWKAALEEVSSLNGWDLHSMSNRREGEFAKKLTEEVFKELKKAYLVVSDYLVSVDNHVDAIMEMIGAQTSETRIIGIHGMGGIGKTTTAKIIYNKLANNFKNCCFLCDIRETSKCNGIQYLQNQLISGILKEKCMDIKDIDEGIKTIKDRLSNERVLLLLDDAEEENHISALVGKRDWLGRGSKIIITTRNKDILEVPKVDGSYELRCMGPKQSLQLFSKHAFRKDFPSDEYIDLSERAMRIASGLPLTLEVIGSLLGRTKKEKWDPMLKKLENVPHATVQSKLRISYDALNQQQQHMFLDIACLFIGYDKDIMVHFWDESKFFPKEAVEVLQNMSLIEITEDNKVWMQGQLRDLGRDIVRQESHYKIEKQRRVWDHKEGFDLLRKHEGKKEVQALCLKLEYQLPYCFTYEDFKRLSDLRFLEVDVPTLYLPVEERLLWHESPSNVPPIDENSDLLPRLRWLSWSHFPPELNITNFFVENVVVLNLSESKITYDWKGWSHMKVMRNLKVLNLSKCRKLERLPNELGRELASLEYLYLKGCGSLDRLPDSIENLESLIELDISKTRIKDLPDSISKLKNLKKLKMLGSDISKISDALWTIGKLEEIEISKENSHQNFHVNIDNCISENQSLRILTLGGADIYSLPMLPKSLVTLHLSWLHMDTFPDLSNSTNLKELCLKFCSRDSDEESHGPLEEYTMPWWIGSLSKLESLSLDCPYVTILPIDLTLPPHLKKLCLGCPKLRCLPRLPSSLSSLHLDKCMSLCSVDDLSNLKNLSSLKIRDSEIKEIQGLRCLENLRALELHSLQQLERLPDLSNLNKLTSLHVRCCGLVEIQGELPQILDELVISACDSLQNLPDLSSLMGKQQVEIKNCSKLKVEAILGFAQINPRRLQLLSFGQLEILPDVSNLSELRSLEVRNCDNLIEIKGKLPESLQQLVIDSCKSLEKLPDLSSLDKLQKVTVNHCTKLDVEAISSLCSEKVQFEVDRRMRQRRRRA